MNTNILFSRPALGILGCKPEWKQVLRELGKMLFFVSPDPSIADYDECYKICMNQFHFLNSHLFVNKTGGKKPVAKKKTPTQPKIQTSRALQRLSVLIMSGFLLNLYQQLPEGHVYEEFGVCDMIDTLIAKITPSKGESNILRILGYEIALRSWIKDHTGALLLHDKKPRGKKDGEQLQGKVLQLENTLRDLESQLDALKRQLRDAQKSIQALQHLQHGQETMQTWFSMNKCLIEGLLHGAGEKSPADDHFSEEGRHFENDGLSDENSDDENEDSNDANEKVEQLKENKDDGEEDAEDIQEVVMQESDNDEVGELDNE
jgi:hypothetical protein